MTLAETLSGAYCAVKSEGTINASSFRTCCIEKFGDGAEGWGKGGERWRVHWGGKSSGAAIGERFSVIGRPVGGVEGWHRSIISGDDDGADGSVVVSCGGSWSAVGSGPGLPWCLANHGSVARR